MTRGSHKGTSSTGSCSPICPVFRAAQAGVSYVGAVGKFAGENFHKLAQVFVEEELHAKELVRRRSRAAAKPGPPEYLPA